MTLKTALNDSNSNGTGFRASAVWLYSARCCKFQQRVLTTVFMQPFGVDESRLIGIATVRRPVILARNRTTCKLLAP
jgi:hypothetical protein